MKQVMSRASTTRSHPAIVGHRYRLNCRTNSNCVYHAKSGLSFAQVSNCEQKASSSSSLEDPVGILGLAGQI